MVTVLVRVERNPLEGSQSQGKVGEEIFFIWGSGSGSVRETHEKYFRPDFESVPPTTLADDLKKAFFCSLTVFMCPEDA